jgi:hypothetical protein
MQLHAVTTAMQHIEAVAGMLQASYCVLLLLPLLPAARARGLADADKVHAVPPIPAAQKDQRVSPQLTLSHTSCHIPCFITILKTTLATCGIAGHANTMCMSHTTQQMI